AGSDEVVDEAVVVLSVRAVPFDVDDVALQRRQIRHPDEAPLGVRAAIDQHGLGVVVQQLPGLLRRDVSGVAHNRKSSTASWGRSNRPSMLRPRVRTTSQYRFWCPAPCRNDKSLWQWRDRRRLP